MTRTSSWQIGWLFAVLITGPSWAHDANAPLAAWYNDLIRADGQSCCNAGDCRTIASRLTDKGWEVLTDEDGWVEVPEEAIVRVENPTGEPVACLRNRLGRWPRVRCFVPGPQT